MVPSFGDLIFLTIGYCCESLSGWIRIDLGRQDKDPDLGGQKDPPKK
jgi:hypothetical protein